MLVFKEMGKPEYPEKNLLEGENQEQTQRTYGVDARIRTRATLVGGERSHHCATLADSYPVAIFCVFGVREKIGV